MRLVKVSLLIPCRNEIKYISQLVKNIIDQDYSSHYLEIFFIDGMSNDGTRQIIQSYINKYNNFKLIDNNNKTVPFALNEGIRISSGEIIIRLDAHAIYPKNYITELVKYIQTLDADNVGGVWETMPANNSYVAKGIAISLSSLFGVGNADYRLLTTQKREYYEVDTVPFGCYKREIFDKIGLFDEDLTRNQDNEFNERIINAGGKIYLIPSIKIIYFARENYIKLFNMFFQYGYFGPLVDIKLRKTTRLRRYIPSLFVLSLLFPILFSTVNFSFVYITISIFSFYFIIAIIFSLIETYKRRSIYLVPFVLYAYLISHLAYGLGYIKGFISFIVFRSHLRKKIEVKLSR